MSKDVNIEFHAPMWTRSDGMWTAKLVPVGPCYDVDVAMTIHRVEDIDGYGYAVTVDGNLRYRAEGISVDECMRDALRDATFAFNRRVWMLKASGVKHL